MRRVLFWQYWHKRDYNRLGSALTPPSNSGVLMQIVLRGAAAGYEAEHTARIFYPAAELSQTLPDDTADLVLAVAHRHLLLVLVRQNGPTTWVQQRPPQGDARTQEYALCRMLYTMLCGVTGIRPPWGMMTGVRPVRIIHDLRAAGESEEAIAEKFLGHFACTPEKFKLALGIADLQRPVLDAADPMDCSIYAGIPFCPTRCSYCSFVSRTVGDKATRALVQPYVDKLCRELTAIRETADRCGLRIRTFYIGGGTPTSLGEKAFGRLLRAASRLLAETGVSEFTVEAGRPDCFSPGKLAAMEAAGVNRISVNPQTFHDRTLKLIGRRHTVTDFYRAYAMVRQSAISVVNMDLIIGLPQESEADIAYSLEQAKSLAPENLTVHTLTLKRSAPLFGSAMTLDAGAASRMVERGRSIAQAMGLAPYYLYRQHYMLGHLANIGYAKPGTESVYNIQMMEERHPVIGIGPASASKAPLADGHHLRKLNMPKNVATYAKSLPELCRKRAALFE